MPSTPSATATPQYADASQFLPSCLEYSPKPATASQPRSLRSSTLITPAIASEPYCAAAPSRSTCTFLMASTGIAFMSVPVLPRLRAPNRFTSAVVWRRLPFTSTRVWSDPRPRSAAESTRSAPSAPVWRVELNDGEMFASVCARSNWPLCSAAFVSGM